MKRPDPKARMIFYVSPAQYWCLQYIKALTCRNCSELIEDAIKYAVRYINKGETNPRKPKLPKSTHRLDTTITRDTLVAIELLKINRKLFGWSYTDFARYGLNHTLANYERRYPDIAKIDKRYGEKVDEPLS